MNATTRTARVINPGLLIRIYWKIDRENTFSEHWSLLETIAKDLAVQLNLDSINADFIWESQNSRLLITDPQINDTLVIDYIADGDDEENLWIKTKEKFIELLFQTQKQISPISITIVYQAICNGLSELKNVSGREIIRSYGLESNFNFEISQEVPGGKLWLVQVPVANIEDKQFLPITSYLALSLDGTDEQDLTKYLFDTQFFKPDLISSKAFSVQYQYRAIRKSRKLDELIDALQETIKNIVYNNENWSDESSNDLQELAKYFDQLLEISLDLSYYATSIAQQESNFLYLPREIRHLEIWEWQLNRIKSYHQEIRLKNEQCQQLLSSANQAVDIFQARIDKSREFREKKESLLFTIIGLAFAISQLFTYETVSNLLHQVSMYFEPSRVFIIQVLIIILFTCIIYILINKLSKIRHSNIADNSKKVTKMEKPTSNHR